MFYYRFIVVLPDGPCENPAVDVWVKNESAHFIKRWQGLMRGDPVVMTASQFIAESQNPGGEPRGHLVLWGDAKSNPVVAKFLAHPQTPVKWDSAKVSVGAHSFDASHHVPVCYYYNESIPRSGQNIGMILLNSGLTFREAHDKTNSLQNPKLPDWAILDITQAPSAESAGKIVAADFFDDHWQVKPNMPAVDAK